MRTPGKSNSFHQSGKGCSGLHPKGSKLQSDWPVSKHCPAERRGCFALQNFTTGWQLQEVGIAMGCAISPILFIDNLLRDNPHWCKTGGWRNQATIWAEITPMEVLNGRCHQPPPDRSMYISTAETMDELISWARMNIKPSKSRSLSLRRAVRNPTLV